MQKTKCYQNVSIFSLFPTTLSRKQQRWWYQSEKFISVYTYWHIHKIFAVCFLKNLNQIKKSKESFRFKLTVHRSQIGSYNCLRCSMKVVYYILTSTPGVVRIHFRANPRIQVFWENQFFSFCGVPPKKSWVLGFVQKWILTTSGVLVKM